MNQFDSNKIQQFKAGLSGMPKYGKSGLPIETDPLRKAKREVVEKYTKGGQAVPGDVHSFLAEKGTSPEDVRMFTRQRQGNRGSGKRTAMRKSNRG